MYNYKPLPRNKTPYVYVIYDGDILTTVQIHEYENSYMDVVDYYDGRMNSSEVTYGIMSLDTAFKHACDCLDDWKNYGQPRFAKGE